MFAFVRSLVFPRACIGCDREDALLCAECATGAGPAQSVTLAGLATFSCAPYRGAVRDAITSFKQGRRAFARDLAALALPYVDPSLTLVPVPTTRRRRAERGFDQTRVLANALRRACGVAVADALVRCGDVPQHGKSRAERLAATGRFRPRRRVIASDAELVLFDDVRTTGSTLVDAAQALEAAGLRVTGALTIAWTPKETP